MVASISRRLGFVVALALLLSSAGCEEEERTPEALWSFRCLVKVGDVEYDEDVGEACVVDGYAMAELLSDLCEQSYEYLVTCNCSALRINPECPPTPE